MKYSSFIFSSYSFDQHAKTLKLNYSLEDQIKFTETYNFDFDFVEYDERALDQAIQILFFLAGVSYYKTYIPRNIVVNAGKLDQELSDFLSKTYQEGLGEFWYVNNLDPATRISFPVNCERLSPMEVNTEGLLVGIGGGKDSLVTTEALRDEFNITTWSLGHRRQLTPLVERIGTTHLFVDRQIDSQLKELNQLDALNGHIPVSAIFAAVGTVVAILSGKRDAITSNEHSADEETLTYKGKSINHQYSKTSEFENDYQRLLEHLYGVSLRYYSFLRPLSELKIAEIFAKNDFDKYADVFSSCNRAYVQSSDHMSWCGECSKCAFVFLMLYPFVDEIKLCNLWSGKNLLKDPNLEDIFNQLLGISGNKPLDCIGEVKESRSAMILAQQKMPELKIKYVFPIPEDYNYRDLHEHSMPAEIHKVLTAHL